MNDKSLSFFFLIFAIVASNLLGSAIAAMIVNDNDKQEDNYTQTEEQK